MNFRDGRALRHSRTLAHAARIAPIHGFSNEGDVDARFLAIISPGLMGSGYFKDVADVLGGDGPPDIEKLGEVMRRHGLTPAPPT